MKILVLALCLALAGCGGASSDAEQEVEEEAEEEREGVFDPLIGTLDKANNVENQVMDHKDRTDQAIAESELSGDENEDDQDD
jgi:hypothetical protein